MATPFTHRKRNNITYTLQKTNGCHPCGRQPLLFLSVCLPLHRFELLGEVVAGEVVLNQVGQVIMQDDENCKLIMDCRFQYQKGSYLALWPDSPQTHHFVRDDINYRVTIECKDGRYRIKITNIKLNYVRKLYGGFEMDYPVFINKNNTQNEWMEYAKSELVKIEATDTTKMKKKELYDYKVRLCAAKESVELYTHLNQFEYDYLFGKINSIKKALEKDDDF